MARERTLLTGDTIEYSVTVEVAPHPGSKFWVKMGGTTKIAQGERPELAAKRLSKFIEGHLQDKIEDIK